jgi:hypothetical protein
VRQYIIQGGLSPAPVFFFAGLWNVVTGILFRGIFNGKKYGYSNQ